MIFRKNSLIYLSIVLLSIASLSFSNEPSRHLVAMAKGSGHVYLGWRFLSSDPPDIGFNVYRAEAEVGPFEKQNITAITSSTNYIDEGLTNGSIYYYMVRAVDAQGNEGPNSNVAKVTAANTDNNLYLTLSGITESIDHGPGIGDLNGDGLLDFVVADLNNADSDDSKFALLRAYLHNGSAFWTFQTGYNLLIQTDGIPVPFAVWDLNNDGKAEIIARTVSNSKFYLTIIDGSTANPFIIDEIEFPEELPGGETNPHYLSVAYLDGYDTLPSIITQVKVHSNERVTAFNIDQNLNLSERWDFCNTDPQTTGSGAHGIEAADIDDDGEDEVFIGSLVLEGNGSIKWYAGQYEYGYTIGHADVVRVGEINPNNPGKEVLLVIEGTTGLHGVFLVDKNGHILWQDGAGWQHGHDGWVTNLTDDIAGAEIYAYDEEAHLLRIYDCQGNLLYEENQDDYFTYGNIVQWDEDLETEVLWIDRPSTRIIKDFDGQAFHTVESFPNNSGHYDPQLDIVGDYRDEIFVPFSTSFNIYTNTDLVNSRNVAAWENLRYRQVASQAGASYWKYFPPIEYNFPPYIEISLSPDTIYCSPSDIIHLNIAVTNHSHFSPSIQISLNAHLASGRIIPILTNFPANGYVMPGDTFVSGSMSLAVPKRTPPNFQVWLKGHVFITSGDTTDCDSVLVQVLSQRGKILMPTKIVSKEDNEYGFEVISLPEFVLRH